MSKVTNNTIAWLATFLFGIFFAIVFGFLIYSEYKQSVAAEANPHSERIDKVVNVLMHEPGDYTLGFQGTGTTVLWRHVPLWNKVYPKTFSDVPPDQPMWAVVTTVQDREGNESKVMDLELHLHSGSDVNGAGWDHGKFGSGQTTQIK